MAGDGEASHPSSQEPPGATRQDDRTRDTSSQPARHQTERRRQGVFHRYLVPLVLLALALLAGAGALVIFPRHSSVAKEGGLTSIEVDASFVPHSIFVELSNTSRGTGLVVFVTTVSRPSTRAYIGVTVPHLLWGGQAYCGSGAFRCVQGPYHKFALYRLSSPTRWSDAGYHYYREQTHIGLPGLAYNVSSNDEYVAVTLPNVTDVLIPSNEPRIPLEVSLSVELPQAARYAWTSGPLPSIVGNNAHWEFTSATASTAEVNGVSLEAQDKDTRSIFISGALIGVAGAALIAALQEAVKR
jgi:hypothetical protein